MEWNETSAKLDAVSIMIVATRVRRILCVRGTAFLGLSVPFRCCGLLDLCVSRDLRLGDSRVVLLMLHVALILHFRWGEIERRGV